MLTFDHEAHVYSWNGVPVPNVTKILGPLGFDYETLVPSDELEEARALGEAIHETVRLEVAGDLDEDSLDDPLRRALWNWREFVVATDFEVLFSEFRVYSQRYGYAGTLDLLGRFRKRRVCALIDIKKAAIPIITRPQTAAYLEALREELERIGAGTIDATDLAGPSLMNGELSTCRRYGLQLNGETWKLSPEFRDEGDFRIFLSALNIHRFVKNWRIERDTTPSKLVASAGR